MPPGSTPSRRFSFATSGQPQPKVFRPYAPSRATSRGSNSIAIRPVKPPLQRSVVASLSPHFTLYVRSFESSARFARPFTSQGDARTFSTEVGRKITARIHLQIDVTFDFARGKIYFSTTARSSETHQYNFPAYPFTYERRGTAVPTHHTAMLPGRAGQTYSFNVQAAEPIMAGIPIVGQITPNISLNGFFNVSCINNQLFINGAVFGDGFPDAECFVVDVRGKAVMLGTYKHSSLGSPLWSLPGDGNMQMMEIGAIVKLDSKYGFVWGQYIGHRYNAAGRRDIPITSAR